MLNSKRVCQKCGISIPNRALVNGKIHVINKRKFCLACSPFGSHNTKPDDPSRASKKSLREDSRIAWRKSADRKLQQARELKQELVGLSGGGCGCCGYSRCLAALEFHHKDPSTKLFQLSIGNLRCKKRAEILAEWSKCTLMCANCHRETQYINASGGT